MYISVLKVKIIWTAFNAILGNDEDTPDLPRGCSFGSGGIGPAQVDTASVPGGYYSNRVGETAAAAGVRVLFNSEPTTKVHAVLGTVVGRYNIFRGTPAAISGNLVSVSSEARSRQWLFWNFKKIAKNVAGRPYLAARQLLLRKG